MKLSTKKKLSPNVVDPKKILKEMDNTRRLYSICDLVMNNYNRVFAPLTAVSTGAGALTISYGLFKNYLRENVSPDLYQVYLSEIVSPDLYKITGFGLFFSSCLVALVCTAGFSKFFHDYLPQKADEKFYKLQKQYEQVLKENPNIELYRSPDFYKDCRCMTRDAIKNAILNVEKSEKKDEKVECKNENIAKPLNVFYVDNKELKKIAEMQR